MLRPLILGLISLAHVATALRTAEHTLSNNTSIEKRTVVAMIGAKYGEPSTMSVTTYVKPNCAQGAAVGYSDRVVYGANYNKPGPNGGFTNYASIRFSRNLLPSEQLDISWRGEGPVTDGCKVFKQSFQSKILIPTVGCHNFVGEAHCFRLLRKYD